VGGWGGIFRADVAVKVINPVTNIKVLFCKATNYTALYQSANMVKWSDNIEIGHCEAVNNQAYFVHVIMTKHLNFHDNVIEQKNLGDKWLHAGAAFRAVQDSSFTNNQLNSKGGGRAFNGFFFESMPPISALGGVQGASNINLIITGNKINRCKEEGILIERSRTDNGTEYANMADVIAATATTVSKAAGLGYGLLGKKVWTDDMWKDMSVAIVYGKGLGQVRQVVSNTNTTLTIDSPWEVIPDTTSIFSVMYHTNNVLVDNNTIHNTGKASLAPYQCCGTTVTNNVMSKCMSHEWDTATVEMMHPNVGGQFADDDGALWPNYNNVISDNTIRQQEAMIGIRVGNTNFDSKQTGFRHGLGTYNIKIENNTINMAGANNGPNPIVGGTTEFSGSVAIVVESGLFQILQNVVVRGNNISNAYYGVWVGGQFEDDASNFGLTKDVVVDQNLYNTCTYNLHIPSTVLPTIKPAIKSGRDRGGGIPSNE
jgi:hypothetical protein